MEEEFLNAGVHVGATPEMDTNDDESGPTLTRGEKPRRSTSVLERARHSRRNPKESQMSSELQA